MPQINKRSNPVSPSLHGSAPVSDVLSRIQVRDPRHPPSGATGRRVTDYEAHRPSLQTFMLMALAALLTSGAWWLSLRRIAAPWPFQNVSGTSAAPATMAPAVPAIAPLTGIPVARDVLQIPKAGLHPSRPAATAIAPLGPDGLRVRFMGPRSLELVWDSMGEGYKYEVLASPDFAMRDAIPLFAPAIPRTFYAWSPDENIQDAWVAVRGFSPTGLLTALGRPVFVRLP